MRKFNISEADFRALAERLPFHEIARLNNVDYRTVGALAKLYGIRSRFIPGPATPYEIRKIAEMSAAGVKIKRIADALGRSQDFVSSRINGRAERHNIHAHYTQQRSGWPRPTVTDTEALGNKTFEDVPVKSTKHPLNGAAIASAAQAAQQYIGSAAAMCEDA